jgi:hypothetical protein
MPDNADPKPRTIDERLEGLTQTVELIARMQLENEKRFEKRFVEFDKRFAEIANILQQIATNQKRDGEHILALVRIAELHDRRLTHLEGPQQ